MKLLFIDACPRGAGVSRTHKLCEVFLGAYTNAHPDAEVETVALSSLNDMHPYTGDMVKRRESLIDAGCFSDPIFDLARQFSKADRVLIGASYWDLSFPSILKVYIEHIFARGINFVYDDTGAVGLARAQKTYYITTSGSPIAENDFGTAYIRATMSMLGIPEFESVSAEGLDIIGNDAEAIMKDAERRVKSMGERPC